MKDPRHQSSICFSPIKNSSVALSNKWGAEPTVHVTLGGALLKQSWLTLFMPDSNQKQSRGCHDGNKTRTTRLVSALALALLRWWQSLPEGHQRRGYKALWARLAYSDSAACSSFFQQVRMLSSPSLSSTTLNRTAGLWLHRDSVIWAATGLRSQPCTHTLSGRRTHQHEGRQRDPPTNTNIMGM